MGPTEDIKLKKIFLLKSELFRIKATKYQLYKPTTINCSKASMGSPYPLLSEPKAHT